MQVLSFLTRCRVLISKPQYSKKLRAWLYQLYNFSCVTTPNSIPSAVLLLFSNNNTPHFYPVSNRWGKENRWAVTCGGTTQPSQKLCFNKLTAEAPTWTLVPSLKSTGLARTNEADLCLPSIWLSVIRHGLLWLCQSEKSTQCSLCFFTDQFSLFSLPPRRTSGANSLS